jgi:preprotein translocase subunit SecD
MVKDKGTILFFFIIFLILYAGKSIEQTKGDMNGQETIKYNLIKSSIEAVSYALTFDSTYSIDIKLTKKSTEEFRELTKNNIGKSLRIFKGNHIIQVAIIKAEIPSGLISINNLKSGYDVIKYIKILLQ